MELSDKTTIKLSEKERIILRTHEISRNETLRTPMQKMLYSRIPLKGRFYTTGEIYVKYIGKLSKLFYH